MALSDNMYRLLKRLVPQTVKHTFSVSKSTQSSLIKIKPSIVVNNNGSQTYFPSKR